MQKCKCTGRESTKSYLPRRSPVVSLIGFCAHHEGKHHMSISRRACLSLGLVLAIAACTSSNSPLGTIQNFYAAVEKGDADKAANYVAFGNISDNEMMAAKGKLQMMVAEGKNKIEKNGGLSKVALEKEELNADGESGAVVVKLHFKNNTEQTGRFKVVKEKGDWKIRL